MKNIMILILLFFCMSYVQDINYKVHSMFIYYFTKYIEWSNKENDFVIGVVGKSNITDELDKIALTKKVGNQRIVIKTINDAADVIDCNIVFLPFDVSNQFQAYNKAISGKQILLVTENPGLCSKGAGINFIIVDSKLKIELNKSVIEKSNLKIAGDLIKLAIII